MGQISQLGQCSQLKDFNEKTLLFLKCLLFKLFFTRD